MVKMTTSMKKVEIHIDVTNHKMIYFVLSHAKYMDLYEQHYKELDLILD